MSQTATEIPPKGLWKVKIEDFLKGAYLSCSAQILALLDFWMHADHFPTMDEWRPYLKATLYFFVLYILKNFGTNNTGQFLKKDKPVITVPEKEISDLIEKADDGKGGDRPKDPPKVP